MRYIVHTVEDLEKILRENPEWRERIRVLILTEELIKLPQKLESFVEEDFKLVKQKVENIEKDVSGLKQDITGVKQDVTTLKQDIALLKKNVGVLKVDVARLRGDNFERKIREKAPAFLGKAIKKLRPIDNYALADILDDALEKGLIFDQEREFAIKLDFAGKGRLREKDTDVYIALGATLSPYSEDVEKTFKRAEILSRAVYTETIPVVVYLGATEKAFNRAEVFGVLAVKTTAED